MGRWVRWGGVVVWGVGGGPGGSETFNHYLPSLMNRHYFQEGACAIHQICSFASSQYRLHRKSQFVSWPSSSQSTGIVALPIFSSHPLFSTTIKPVLFFLPQRRIFPQQGFRVRYPFFFFLLFFSRLLRISCPSTVIKLLQSLFLPASFHSSRCWECFPRPPPQAFPFAIPPPDTEKLFLFSFFPPLFLILFSFHFTSFVCQYQASSRSGFRASSSHPIPFDAS